LEKIDILKIDIDGAEKDVFADKKSWIDKVDTIIIEQHDSLNGRCEAVVCSELTGFHNQWLRGENVFIVQGKLLRAFRSLFITLFLIKKIISNHACSNCPLLAGQYAGWGKGSAVTL